MRVLLDTHTLVWALSNPDSLSAEARRTLADSEVLVSVASLWELILKRSKKGTLLTDPIPWWKKYVLGSGISILGITPDHVMALDDLEDIHRDPFDRILLAQSLVEKAPLVTKDSQLAAYGISVIW